MDISYIEKMRAYAPSQPESLIWNQASAFSVNLFAALAFTEESEYQSHKNPNISLTSQYVLGTTTGLAMQTNITATTTRKEFSLFPIAH